MKLISYSAALLALSSTLSAGAASMVTGSQFAVSESGAATLTIPIQVPRGIGGMEPQLSLDYSSSAGNGLLGIGWTLTGPSAITRCPKNITADGVRGAVTFKTGDRFCLDGQRLEITNLSNTDAVYGTANSVYSTEKDSFSRITAIGQYGGQPNVPSSFKVETKSGLILEFGISANSQVLTTNIPSGLTAATINRWMLQRISDRHGSFVEFFYCGGEVSADGATCNATEGTAGWTGSKVLHYVRYTNRAGAVNGEFAVVLGYEARPDRNKRFYLGSIAQQTQRISRIETYRDFAGPALAQRGKLVKGYDVTYEPLVDSAGKSIRATNTSRVQQIQERDASGNRLPPIQLTMAPDAVFGQAVAQTAAAPSGTPRPPESCGGIIATRMRIQCP